MSGKPKKRKIDDGYIHEYRMITVTDDWYGCYENNQICVGAGLIKLGKTYHVTLSAHGNDDFGVCMKFSSESYEQAYHIYSHWKKFIYDRIPDGVNVEWFYEHGFYHD